MSRQIVTISCSLEESNKTNVLTNNVLSDTAGLSFISL